MAFVMRGGDYERALRLAGASNFMEAFESGIDRGIRRQAMRDQAVRARDLFNRQSALESGSLMAEIQELDEGWRTGVASPAGTAGGTVGGTLGAGAPPSSAVSVAGGGPVAAAIADAVSTSAAQETPVAPAIPAQAEQAVAAATPILGVTPRAVGVVEEELPGEPTYHDMPTERPWWWGGRTYEEAFPAREPERTLGPRRAVDWKTLPPEEFALATPRGSSQREVQIKEALRLISEGRTIDAQELLGASAQAYPELGVETATSGPPIPLEAGSREEALGRAVQELMRQGRYVDAQSLVGEGGQVYPDLGVESATGGGVPIDDGDVDEWGLHDAPIVGDVGKREGDWMLAPIVGDPPTGEGGVTEGPGGATGSATTGAGALISAAIPSMLERALQAPGAFAGAAAGRAVAGEEQRRLEAFEENALGASMGDLGFGSPLQDAVSQQAVVAEEVELAGPEPEVVKVDQTVDVGGKVYTVKKGDTLGRISSSFGAPLSSVVAANQDVLAPGGKSRQIKRGEKVLLEGQDLIYPGDKIRIPTGQGRETGGEAGPIDPRPDSGQAKGVLAKVEETAKTDAEVRTELNKIQAKQPNLPLNPFQKFGRPVDYLPSLKAVAFATLRAQQGDFTMLNQMAGRVVRNSELPTLFSEYSNFVRGAKRNAKEVYLQQKLLKETQTNEAKRKAAIGVQAMAFTQFQRAGRSPEDAELLAGKYVDMWAVDPQQARAWGKSLDSMGSSREKAELQRIKRGGFGRGGGSRFTSKEINKAYTVVDKAQGRLTSAIGGLNRALAPGGIPLSLEEMKKAAQENPGFIASVGNYERALTTYNRADKRLSEMLRADLPEEGPSSVGVAVSWAQGNKRVMENIAVARKEPRSARKWSVVEDWLATLPGVDEDEAREIRRYFEEEKPQGDGDDVAEEEVAPTPRKTTRPPIVSVGGPGEVSTFTPPEAEEYPWVRNLILPGGVGVSAQKPSTPTQRQTPSWVSEGLSFYKYWKWLNAQPGTPPTRRPTEADWRRYRLAVR